MSYKNFTTAGIKLEIDVKDAFKGVEDTSSFLNKQLKSMELHADSFTSKWGDMTRGIKDTKRIVSGIFISQAFYTLSSAVVQTTKDIVSFSANMEQAAISMEYFIKNAEGGANALAKSQAYLREINRFAARTPFSTEQTLQLSRYMQAMGMGIETTKSFFTVMTDAASATGGTSDQLDRAVIAMGRMKAQGRITSREIRQLAAANIPVYEILREELNLTGAQVAKLGDQWVSADVAMTGILRGLEKRYEGAADRMADTFTGMTNIIKDNIKIIGQAGGASLFEGLTGGMMTFRNALQEYREIAIEQGAGGLLNELLHNIDATGALGTKILTLVGTYYQLKDALTATYIAAKPVRELLGNTLYASVITITNGIIGLSKVVNNTIKGLEKFGISGYNAANMLASLFITYKVGSWLGFMGQAAIKGAWALIETAKAASMVLPAALQARAGIAALTMSIGGLIVYGLAAVGVFKTISSTLAGLDTAATGGNILPDSYMKEFEDYKTQFEEYNNAIDEYKNAFDTPFEEMADGADEAVDGFDKVKDASKKAANAVKNDWLASFDEVYTIPKEVANAGDKLGDLLENPDFGLGLQPPVFKFPKIDSIEITSPKLNIKDVFGGSPWADMDIDGLDKSWWKKMLPGIISLGLMRILAPFAKNLQDRNKGTAGVGSKAPGSLGDILDLTPEELLAAIDKLGSSLTKQLTKIQEMIDNIKSGQLTGADLDRAIRILGEANTKALGQLEKLNDLNFLANKEAYNVSQTLLDAAKVLKENKIAQLSKQLADIDKHILEGGGTGDVKDQIKLRDKLRQEMAELMGDLPKGIYDYLNNLNEGYLSMVKSIVSKDTMAEQIKLIQGFNRELKEANALLKSIGDIKLDTKYKDILKTSNRIADTTKNLESRLKTYIEKRQQQQVLQETRRLNVNSGMVPNNERIIRYDKAIEDLGKQLQKLQDEITTHRYAIEDSSDEIREQRIAEANRIRERKQRDVAEAAERKRLAEERKAQIKEDNKIRTEANRLATEAIEAQKMAIEASREIALQREMDKLFEANRAEEIAANRADLAELNDTLNEIKSILYDNSDSQLSISQLKDMAKTFGIDQALPNSKALFKAYETKMAELNAEIADIKTILDASASTPAKRFPTAKEMVDAYMGALQDETPVMSEGRLPVRGYIDTLPNALKALNDSAEGLADAFTATGTKMLTLSRGMGEYGNSAPEMFANILKDNYKNLIPNLTSRNFTPFLELVSNLGIELEDHIIFAAKQKVASIGELFRSSSSIGLADKSLITQIDAFIDTLAGGIIPTDVKTISGDMSAKLWESGKTSIELIERYKAEWFHQFAAQVYSMTDGAGGDFGLITFDRDFDFGPVIAKRFHETFHLGEIGNIFNPDVIKKATQGKTDRAAIAKYIKTLQENVFFDTFTQTVDMSPLQDAINVGTLNYSKALLDTMSIPAITQSWRAYTNMLVTVMEGSGIENFLNTYVEFETTLGQMVFPVNVAGIPRVYTKAGNSLNKWLQTVLDQPDIKLSGTFKSGGKELQAVIDKLIKDFNDTLDVDKFTKGLTALKTDLQKVITSTRDAFKPLEMSELSDAYGHITGLLDGTASDFDKVVQGLDALIGKPGTVEHTGRILRSAIERTNSINNSIAEGIEVTASELFAVKRNLKTLAKQFGMETDLLYRQAIGQLNNMMAEIKVTGDAAILELGTAIKLPFKTVGIEKALEFAAGEIQQGLAKGFIKFNSIIEGSEALEAFDEAISNITPKPVSDISRDITRLSGAMKRLIVDIEATGIDLREALISQIAIKDIDTGEKFMWYINRGAEQNAKVLETMQNVRDANTPFYEFVQTRMNSIMSDVKAGKISLEMAASDYAALPDPHKFMPEFLEKFVSVIADQTKSFEDVMVEMLDWAELTDVAKVWQNVTVEMLNAGKSMSEVGKAIKQLINEMPTEWSGHNLGEYDLLALVEKFPDIDFTHYVDTLTLAERAFDGISYDTKQMNLKLTTLYEALTGQTEALAHMADADIEMTHEILKLLDSDFAPKLRAELEALQNAGIPITKEIVRQATYNIVEGINSATQQIVSGISAGVTPLTAQELAVALNGLATQLNAGASKGQQMTTSNILGQNGAGSDITVQDLVRAIQGSGNVTDPKLSTLINSLMIDGSKLALDVPAGFSSAADVVAYLGSVAGALNKVTEIEVLAIDETLGLIQHTTPLSEMLGNLLKASNIMKVQEVVNDLDKFARMTSFGGDRFSFGKGTLGSVGAEGEMYDEVARFFMRFGWGDTTPPAGSSGLSATSGAKDFAAGFDTKSKVFSVDVNTVSKVMDAVVAIGKALKIGTAAYGRYTTDSTYQDIREDYDIEGGKYKPWTLPLGDSGMALEWSKIPESRLDTVLSAFSLFDAFSTRSGAVNLSRDYFDLEDVEKMFFGEKYFGETDWRKGAFGGSLIGRGGITSTYAETVMNRKPGFGGKIKKSEAESYLQEQIGSESAFDAIADYILKSGDTESPAAKAFYKNYGAYMDTIIEPAYGLTDEWRGAANVILGNMGEDVNKALTEAGLKPLKDASEIDLAMKPYFDNIMEAMHSVLIDDIAGKLAVDREHTYGHSLSDSRVDRVIESDRMDNLPVGALNMLQNELGITISKINDEFGKVSFDTNILTEELSGWTKRLPEGLDLSAANLTPKEVSILAQAGIQVNGDGSVTFMKAPIEAMSGTSRSLDITLDDMSKAVLDKLSAQGISVGIDGSLDLSAEELSSKMTSALFKTNTSLQGRVSDDMKQALSGLGNVLDSGYIEITNTAVLNGSMTIAEYIGSMGEKANELSPKVLETLLALDEVIAQGGEATALSVAQWADGIVMPSPINEEALTEEMRAAFAAVGITFEQGAEGFMMVVNKLGDDLSDGVTLMPKELWDQLDSDIVAGLKAMGVTITEQGGYVRVDLTTTLKDLVDVKEITPSIETAMGQLGATFIVEGGKIVGVADKSGKELTDGMLQISERILRDVDPATLKALEALGVTIEEENEKMFVNFTGMTETGIEDVIELYVNRPDLWDQIPDSIKTVLEDANIMNNEGMLTIKTDMLGMLVKVGEDWVGNWNKLPPETQKALGLTDAEVKDGLFKITRTTEDADIDGLLEGQILVPFSELPPEIKKKMTGPGGVDEELKNSYFIIEGTTESGMANMFDAVHIGFNNAATEAGNGAAAIATAVQKAMKDVANLNAVSVKKNYNPFANKDKPKWAKNKTGTGYTVRYGGNTYTAPVARTISQAQDYINQKYGIIVPAFKKGGLITGDGLYRAGEFGRTEAVLPLEDPAAMARVGAAIAAFMPFSNVFDIGAATQGALVSRIQTVLTAENEKRSVATRELYDESQVILKESHEKDHAAYAEFLTSYKEISTGVDKVSTEVQATRSDLSQALSSIAGSIQSAASNITSSVQETNRNLQSTGSSITSAISSLGSTMTSTISSTGASITSAISSIKLSSSSTDSDRDAYRDRDDNSSSSSPSSKPSSKPNTFEDSNPLGMTYSDLKRYINYKKYAQEIYNDTGKWDKELHREAQAIRDKYGIKSDKYHYTELTKYIGSARGSLVTKDALYRAGEGGLNEAIIPLERPEIMARVGKSIAHFMPDASQLRPAIGMQDAGVRRINQAPPVAPQQQVSEDMIARRVLEVVLPAMASRSEGDASLRPMYVGTLVADERGLKELNKKMKVIEASETKRGVR